jgi:hypothetical protein
MPVSRTSEEQSCKIKRSIIQPSVQRIYQNVTRVHTIGKEANCVKANQFEGHFNTIAKAVNIGRGLSYSKGICSHKWVCPSKHGDQPKLDCQLQKICLPATPHLSKWTAKAYLIVQTLMKSKWTHLSKMNCAARNSPTIKQTILKITSDTCFICRFQELLLHF